MSIVEVFAKFLPPFFGIFTQHRQGAFVLPGRMQLNVDIFIFQKRLMLGICATTPIEPRIAKGALTILFATQAII
ncbi:Uncharacterised protein [Klebsiella michiganensis]|nr:Uncharacterised protein [Klebsiella michiganensis]